MDDNIKNIIALCISGYAAVISTVALIWNITNTILDKISKIEVRANFYTTMAFYGPDVKEGPGILQISIINKSKRIKYIKVPQLKLSYDHGWNLSENDKEKNIINLHLNGADLEFPIEMKPETEVVLKYPLASGLEWMYRNARKSDKFRVIITDTTHKKYKSSKIKIKMLKECIEHNLTINPNLITEIVKTNKV